MNKPIEHASLTKEELVARDERAHQVDRRIAQVVRRSRADMLVLADLLLDVQVNELYATFGASSMAAYAVDREYVESPRMANELAELAANLTKLRIFRAAMQAGELPWTKARTAAAAAVRDVPARESHWLEQAKQLSSRKLEAEVRKQQGLPQQTRRMFVFDGNDEDLVVERIREVQAEARRNGETLTDGQALARLCRRAGASDAAPVAGDAAPTPPSRMTVHACECGDKAWLEVRDGRTPVSKATLEQAQCDAEVVDATGGPAKVTTTVPPKIRRHVFERDRGRCRVPGCRNRRYLELHHEPARADVGHDPDAMLVLCDAHHAQRHEGGLRIVGRHSTGFRFFLHDGTELVDRSREELRALPSVEGSTATNLQLAKVALRNMEVGAREADRLLARARLVLEAKGEACTVEALVMGALVLT